MRLTNRTQQNGNQGQLREDLLGYTIHSVVVSGSCIEVGPAFNRLAAHVVCNLSQVYTRSVHLPQVPSISYNLYSFAVFIHSCSASFQFLHVCSALFIFVHFPPISVHYHCQAPAAL